MVLLFQVFTLAPSSTLQGYKTNLIDEIEPVITEFFEKAEAGLQVLQKKEKTLVPTISLGTKGNKQGHKRKEKAWKIKYVYLPLIDGFL